MIAIKDQTKEKMAKAIAALNNELAKLRTGRANVGFIEGIKVLCYGNEMPLNQVASISVRDSRTLSIAPWDKSSVTAIEKAISQSGLGLNPVPNGNVILVPIPALTEERRKEMVKIVKTEGEKAKVVIRNARRDGNDAIKKLQKDKTLSEDEARSASDEIQKITDDFISQIDKILADKEKDLMSI